MFRSFRRQIMRWASALTALTLLLVATASARASGVSQLEADIYTAPYGRSGSYPSGLTVFNGRLFFNAYGDTDYGYELWAYDGANPPAMPCDARRTGVQLRVSDHAAAARDSDRQPLVAP